jgi:PAS domain S-box-containing protein
MSVLERQIIEAFGTNSDSMPTVEARIREAFPHEGLIVWEGDAETFAFTYIGGDAEALLGHTPRQWTENPCFWVETVVHPDDQDDAVAYCALATARAADHVFEYRALRPDGSIVWLKDYVRVVLGERGIPVRLRGLMLDITEEKKQSGLYEHVPVLQLPSRRELERMAA